MNRDYYRKHLKQRVFHHLHTFLDIFLIIVVLLLKIVGAIVLTASLGMVIIGILGIYHRFFYRRGFH